MIDEKKLEQNELLIWMILKVCNGRDRALTAKKICRMIHGRFSIRQIRTIIQGLVDNFGFPIAATVYPPYGYFIPQTDEEKREYCNNLTARIKSIATRLRAFEKATADNIIKELSLFENEKGY